MAHAVHRPFPTPDLAAVIIISVAFIISGVAFIISRDNDSAGGACDGKIDEGWDH